MSKPRKARAAKGWASVDHHGRIDIGNIRDRAGDVMWDRDAGERRIRVLVTEVVTS